MSPTHSRDEDTTGAMSQVPLIHMQALTFSHNSTSYAIRGNVTFDFRAPPNLTSVRLRSILPDASGRPSYIDLALFGRWQTVLSPLRKGATLQVENALVASSTDVDVHHFQLELRDTSSRKAVVYVLNDKMVPRKMVTSDLLDEGLRVVPVDVAKKFKQTLLPASAVTARANPNSSRSTTAHGYTPIASLADPHGPISSDTKPKYNIFGVVIDARAPCLTRGSQLRSEIVLVDESCLKDDNSLEAFAVFTFECDPKHATPFRAVGDIARVHRIHISQYTDSSNHQLRRSGSARFYSTFVIWDGEGNDFEPVCERGPVNQPMAAHTLTAADRERVEELREWARERLWKRQDIYRKFMYSVSDVLHVNETEPIIQQRSNFDLVCFLPRTATVDHTTGVIKMKVTNGIANADGICESIRVESDKVIETGMDVSFPFMSFCQSWTSRPAGKDLWMVIRDVTVDQRNTQRVIRMHVGRKSSTIIWLPENSPDIAHIRKKHLLKMSEDVLRPEDLMNVANGYGGMAPVQNNFGNKKGNMPVRSSAAKRRRVSNQADENGASEGRNYTSKEAPTSSGEDAIAELNENGIRAVSVRQGIQVISECAHGGQPIMAISQMLRAMGKKRHGVFRLRVHAQALCSPTDVRYVCKPFCGQCKILLKMDPARKGAECVKCGSEFRGLTDGKIAWMYSFRLLLQDARGTRIDAWVERKEGARFMRKLKAANLLVDRRRATAVSECLQFVLGKKSRHLDCCVIPYEYEDEDGLFRIACKIVRTALLDVAFDGNS